ncbi:MAG: DUF4870 domain-containing protein [Actinomycetota bacterium]
MTDNAMADNDSRLWATLIHLGGIFFHVVPALIGFVVLGDRGAFIRNETRSALNFQLTLLVGYVAGFFTVWILVGFAVLVACVVFNVVFSILAAIAANRGEHWDYPVSITFIRA